jgi:hypothetical protein
VNYLICRVDAILNKIAYLISFSVPPAIPQFPTMMNGHAEFRSILAKMFIIIYIFHDKEVVL